jgi:hypothetical protein
MLCVGVFSNQLIMHLNLKHNKYHFLKFGRNKYATFKLVYNFQNAVHITLKEAQAASPPPSIGSKKSINSIHHNPARSR